jgi:Rod binding domain-containing protein
MNRVGSAPQLPASTTPVNQAERLKKTALQLEGLFVQRLFAAMRDTVPTDGLMSQSSAESTFTQLLDEKFSEQVPKQWNGEHSLAQALYRQLSQRLESQATDSTGSEPR